jgi:outer membrane protein assembly factor BamB
MVAYVSAVPGWLSGENLPRSPTANGDWPQWRYDAGRTAASTHELPGELHLHWVRQFQKPQPAWADPPGTKPHADPSWNNYRRLQFDSTYHPVVMGETIFVPSNAADSVTAIDVATGEIKWLYFAGGPVRFAPIAWNGRIIFGSDDGHVYCLSAGDGRLLWKYRGAPGPRKIIGHERLISCWPVSGGPVLVDGKVYFANGVWPIEGIFYHALDGATGKLIWLNDDPSKWQSVGHWAGRGGKAVPNGYIAAEGETCIMPAGRATPAIFSRSTGEMKNYYNDRRPKAFSRSSRPEQLRGDSPAIAVRSGWVFADHQFFHTSAGIRSPVVIRPEMAWRLPVMGGEAVYDFTGAYHYPKNPGRGAKFQQLWKLADKALHFAIKAGSRLYGYRGTSIVSAEVSGAGPPQVATIAKVAGTPEEMLAGAGRLFVMTRKGHLYCFGPEKRKPRTLSPAPAPDPADDEWTERSEKILEAASVDRGYCLVAGTQTGRLAEEIARQSSLRVIAIGRDADRIEAFRHRMDSAGLYGSRVTALAGSVSDIDLPPYIFDLVTVEAPGEVGLKNDPKQAAAFVKRAFRVLKPYGGTLCLINSRASKATETSARSLPPPGGKIENLDGTFKLTRESLPGAGNWSQHLGNAAGTYCSGDSIVKAPLGIQWFGGPAGGDIYYHKKSYKLNQHPIVSQGRLFFSGPGGLYAVDIYTGRLLWNAPLPQQPWYYSAAADRVYVDFDPKKIGRKTWAFDAKTGNKTGELPIRAGRIWSDLLISQEDGEVLAINRHTGEPAWRHKLNASALVAGGGNVWTTTVRPAELLGLDARSGKILWRSPIPVRVNWWDSMAYSDEHDAVIIQWASRLVAWRGATGKEMWRYPPAEKEDGAAKQAGAPAQLHGPLILNGDIALLQNGGFAFDIRTGTTVKRSSTTADGEVPFSFPSRANCNTALSSKHLLTFRVGHGPGGYFDLTSGGTVALDGFRSGCRNSLVPAGGMLVVPRFQTGCVCSFPLWTAFAMTHRPDVEMWTWGHTVPGAGQVRRLGINFGAPGDHKDENGTLWLAYPRDTKPWYYNWKPLTIDVRGAAGKTSAFRRHSLLVEGKSPKWIGASGMRGIRLINIDLSVRPAFSVRWSGFIKPTYTGTVEFSVNESFKNRLWIDGRLVIDNWRERPYVLPRAKVKLTKDKMTPLVMEFFASGGEAAAQLKWHRQVIPAVYLYPKLNSSEKNSAIFRAEIT